MTWNGAPTGAGSRRLAGTSVRRRGVAVLMAAVAAAVCAALLTGAGLARAAAVRAGGPGVRWAMAVQVPGLAALNADGNAQVTSVSCAPRGYCVAGGYYTDRSGHSQGFVVTGVKGRWGTAVAVPGLVALNSGGSAKVSSVSCPGAGDCAAGGGYAGAGGGQGFVVSEVNGIWGTAEAVPGLAALSTGGGAGVNSVSCGSAGNCAAGGGYDNGAQAFVVSEVNGVWGTAEAVPGLVALNLGEQAGVSSVSCAPDGYCAAAGWFLDSSYDYTSPFVTTASNGAWSTVVPLQGGLASGPSGDIVVSCPAAGSCSLEGTDAAAGSQAGQGQPFVASQNGGVWGSVQALPGILSAGYSASLSCPSPGHCTAAGWYTDAKEQQQAFVGAP